MLPLMSGSVLHYAATLLLRNIRYCTRRGCYAPAYATFGTEKGDGAPHRCAVLRHAMLLPAVRAEFITTMLARQRSSQVPPAYAMSGTATAYARHAMSGTQGAYARHVRYEEGAWSTVLSERMVVKHLVVKRTE
eukprot:591998-Rhodomonas_salina.1